MSKSLPTNSMEADPTSNPEVPQPPTPTVALFEGEGRDVTSLRNPEVLQRITEKLKEAGVRKQNLLFSGHSLHEPRPGKKAPPRTMTFANSLPEFEQRLMDGDESPIDYALDNANKFGGDPVLTVYNGDLLLEIFSHQYEAKDDNSLEDAIVAQVVIHPYS